MPRNFTFPVHANTRPAERSLARLAAQAQKGAVFNVRGARALGQITGNLSEFNKSLEASNARVLAFGASTGVLFAFSRALKGMASASVEVEESLKKINVILGATEQNFKRFFIQFV